LWISHEICVDDDSRLLGGNCSEDNRDSVSVSVGLGEAVEGDDDPEADAVEDEVGDGDPVFGRGPVTPANNPHVFEADTEHENDPGNQKTAVSAQGSEYEKKRAADSESSVKDSVLDDDAGTELNFSILL